VNNNDNDKKVPTEVKEYILATDENDSFLVRSAKHAVRFTVFIVGLIILMFISGCLFYWLGFEGLSGLAEAIASVKPVFSAIRCMLITFVIWYWNDLVSWFGIKKEWTEQQVIHVQGKRWAALSLLAVLELVFVQRLPIYLYGWL